VGILNFMGLADGDPHLPVGSAPAVTYTDAEGRTTDDPAAAVSGEAVLYDEHGIPRRRTLFVIRQRELPWLPVSEAAFLLWVLVILMLVWLAVGLVLYLT
jgi:hypothetical protein